VVIKFCCLKAHLSLQFEMRTLHLRYSKQFGSVSKNHWKKATVAQKV
jgi:hypothetical protein